jgi:hypothetical protein
MRFADAIMDALERHNINVLIDRRNLEYGEEWKPELLDFVRRADAVVFIVSPRSIASRWCRWEVEQVKAESKRLVPIVLVPVPTADLPSQIAEVHLLPFADVWDPARGPGEGFFAQAASLARLLAPMSKVTSLRRPLSPPTQAPPRTPAASPDSSVITGFSLTIAGVATPPLDDMTRNSERSPASRSVPSRRLM